LKKIAINFGTFRIGNDSICFVFRSYLSNYINKGVDIFPNRSSKTSEILNKIGFSILKKFLGEIFKDFSTKML